MKYFSLTILFSVLLSFHNLSAMKDEPSIVSFSTLIKKPSSSYMKTDEPNSEISLREFITAKLGDFSSINWATDQFTDKEMARFITRTQGREVSVIVGENDNDQKAEQILANRLKKLERNCRRKMHNKFIICENKLIMGSFNATYRALNGINIESLVVLSDKEIVNLYQQYFNLLEMICPIGSQLNSFLVTNNEKTSSLSDILNNYSLSRDEFYKLLAEHKSNDKPFQACLAPFSKINDFIRDHFSDLNIEQIKISMFMVGRGTNKNEDIIDTIIKLPKKNRPITLYFDELISSTEEKLYNKLYNAQVQLRPMKKEGRYMHDKLILIKHKNNENKVIIGSAGFTKDVQDNSNYENMLLIKDKETFEYFHEHFSRLEQQYQNNKPKINDVSGENYLPNPIRVNSQNPISKSLAPKKGSTIGSSEQIPQRKPQFNNTPPNNRNSLSLATSQGPYLNNQNQPTFNKNHYEKKGEKISDESPPLNTIPTSQPEIVSNDSRKNTKNVKEPRHSNIKKPQNNSSLPSENTSHPVFTTSHVPQKINTHQVQPNTNSINNTNFTNNTTFVQTNQEKTGNREKKPQQTPPRSRKQNPSYGDSNTNVKK